jgi:WD40 repeat protein
MAVGVLRDGSPVIASGDDDGTVRVWRLADSTPLAHPLDLSEPAGVVALHGKIIVTVGDWDIAIHQPAAP